MPITAQLLSKYLNNYFVETGSFIGDGIHTAVSQGFSDIRSIEFYLPLVDRCRTRFQTNPTVKVIRGNSGVDLERVISDINEPITFWLDAHYSGDGTAYANKFCPVMDELDQISRHPIKTHTILIDDRRLFGREDHMDGIPFPEVTEEAIISRLKEINPNYIISYGDSTIKDDVIIAYIPSMSPTEQFLVDNDVPIHSGKIVLPEDTQHVKLDIGLSYSAPCSRVWFDREENLAVYAFEPKEYNVKSVRRGCTHRPIYSPAVEEKYVGTRFWVLQCALTEKASDNEHTTFYHAWDHGTGSLYIPNEEIGKNQGTEQVRLFTLEKFFEHFPFDMVPIIEYIKLDTQGSDLDILKGAGKYLPERVVWVTVECLESDKFYHNVTNSMSAVAEFLKTQGFEQIDHPNTKDPTFFNTRFPEHKDVFIHQQS